MIKKKNIESDFRVIFRFANVLHPFFPSLYECKWWYNKYWMTKEAWSSHKKKKRGAYTSSIFQEKERKKKERKKGGQFAVTYLPSILFPPMLGMILYKKYKNL